MVNKEIKISIILAIAAAVVIIGVALYYGFSKNNLMVLKSVEVTQGTVSEKINLTGQVKASQGVDMSFESSGKIVANYVKVGDKITAGQSLISIDNSVLQSQLQQAEAQLSQAQAGVDALNINTVQSRADSGLQTAYTSALGYAQKSATVAKNSLIVMTDIQYSHFLGSETNENINIKTIKAEAVQSLLGQPDTGTWNSKSLSVLTGGAFGSVQTAVDNSTYENIDSALSATLAALENVRQFIDAIPIDSSLTATERASIVAEKTYISAEIITISNSIQAISSQKVNNDATITTTNSQIEAAQASVQAIEANIKTIKNQISKTTLRALFNGQVDKDDAIVGQLAVAGSPVITISNSNLEIQVNIPESEIANIKIGDTAAVTLDAFGTTEIFSASVVSMDSAQSTENGIAVYKARIKFTNADERIKSGMTANVSIIPETHENVLVVPSSAVIQKDGKYFVIIDKGNGQKETREVSIGLKNASSAEITSGLASGEKVYSY